MITPSFEKLLPQEKNCCKHNLWILLFPKRSRFSFQKYIKSDSGIKEDFHAWYLSLSRSFRISLILKSDGKFEPLRAPTRDCISGVFVPSGKYTTLFSSAY